MGFFRSETYGDAKAADAVELKSKGFFKEGGFYLGEWGEGVFARSLFHNRDGHILTVAPPGSGKTTGIIIPNLLTYRDGSLIVTDPKGSVTAQTARYRREALGNRVVILNPWRQELTSSMGRDLGETGFNPLYLINRKAPSIIDDAEAAASMMIPIPPTMSEADRYWPETAQTIATGVMIWLAYALADEGGATLPKLYEIARYGKNDWLSVCQEMRRVSAVDLDTYASAIEGLLEAEKQWQGVVGKFQSATSIYNPAKSLGAHVSKNEFDPLDLKKENVTVYVVIPNNRRDANAGWLSLVLQTMAQAVGQPGQARPVLLIAEEFANLGYMPTIASAMAEYREAGLKCHLVIQTLSQLNRIYTPAGADEIKTLCAVRQFFAVNDPVAAKAIEIFSGTITKARA
ncbi:MAG: type IV secretory system conjugative DNA transfer family protein, partial [Henriciella sp.]|nr:type IV secretory system conjugative DNA transfer family protein [Henriciella sp.]